MATLDEVHRKFGEVSMDAQLLEHELGTLNLEHKYNDTGLFENPDPNKATEIENKINERTLGNLKKDLEQSGESIEHIKQLLDDAVESRNRLTHRFYVYHKCDSDDGREVMLRDLEAIHKGLLEAFKEVLRLSGIDPEKYFA